MANMRILIRIVFVIFIANGIDCLGGVCDNCCDCFKNKDENITPESLVNDNWFKAKGNNLVLMIFKQEDDNDIFTSTENGDKISFKLDEKDNSKIAYQDENENKLKLKNEKYALFEIKTKGKNTVYLYCSDVESSKYNGGIYGIFERTTHIRISVIACDTEKVTNMEDMFYNCNSLTELDIKIFNTKNVTTMSSMFCFCENLAKLEFGKNFNTTNVTNMGGMFSGCSRLTKLDVKNFDTINVTNMGFIFHNCSSLTELDLKIFNTKKVTIMSSMFSGCKNLAKLEFGENFNTTKVKIKWGMFDGCKKLGIWL